MLFEIQQICFVVSIDKIIWKSIKSRQKEAHLASLHVFTTQPYLILKILFDIIAFSFILWWNETKNFFPSDISQ